MHSRCTCNCSKRHLPTECSLKQHLLIIIIGHHMVIYIVLFRSFCTYTTTLLNPLNPTSEMTCCMIKSEIVCDFINQSSPKPGRPTDADLHFCRAQDPSICPPSDRRQPSWTPFGSTAIFNKYVTEPRQHGHRVNSVYPIFASG